MNNYLKTIYKLIDEEKFSDALNLVNKIEKEKSLLHPKIYLLKAKLIEILDDENYSLIDIEKNYIEALNIDKNYIDANIDYANFYLDVYDSYESAYDYYMKALELNLIQYNKIQIGRNECKKRKSFEASCKIDISPTSDLPYLAIINPEAEKFYTSGKEYGNYVKETSATYN